MKVRKLSALLVAATMVVSPVLPAHAAEETKTVTVLQTSDIHGMVNPYDYASGKANKTSLAHAATIIKNERQTDPNLLLIDSGDSTQANYIQNFKDDVPEPVMDAFNYLDYNVWTLGNHEFNFGFKYVTKEISEFNGQTLAGNIYKADGSRFSDAYHIYDVDGVRVAIFGIDAPHIPIWEKSDPTHYDNMTFTQPIDETGKILDELSGKADVIVGSIHVGLEGEYGSAGVKEIADKYGSRINGLVIGHAHAKVDTVINGVPILEPESNCKEVSKLKFTVTGTAGNYKVESDKTTHELIDCSKVAPDPDFLAKFKSLDDKSKALAETVVGKVGKTFIDNVDVLPGIPYAILNDNPVLDLVNKVQMQNVVTADGKHADISLAALFNSTSNLAQGDFRDRDSVNVYQYDNTLFGIKVTGKQLKAIMENQCGKFFNQYKPGDVTISFNPNIRMYNYDEFAGVNYDIDISQPVGSRIKNVTYKGAPLADDTTMILAINNYRYGGLVTAGLLNEKDVVYEGGAIRDMVTNYVKGLNSAALMPECDNNWKIIGADLNDPQKDMIYDMVRAGKIMVPASTDGRTPNVASINAIQLRAEGKLPALTSDADIQQEAQIAVNYMANADIKALVASKTVPSTKSDMMKKGIALDKIAEAENGTIDPKTITTPKESKVKIQSIGAVKDSAALTALKNSLISLITKATGDKATVQKISLFDLIATGTGRVSVNVGKDYAGLYAVVGHFHNNAWTTQQCKVDENGNIEPAFASFSPVFVAVTTSQTELKSVANTEEAVSPKTDVAGNETPALPLMAAFLVIAGAAYVVSSKKKKA
ncbi:MAG: 5'-nucleotidase C-terminal domain-containing protein [Lachnospiraceae bacterium]|nr:5'-nucleotidase C-terminal domain-containing protein [Lachnospiraceae bacterium]